MLDPLTTRRSMGDQVCPTSITITLPVLCRILFSLRSLYPPIKEGVEVEVDLAEVVMT